MQRENDANAHQLDFDSFPAPGSTEGHDGQHPARLYAEGPVPLCVVCGRARARLTLKRGRGHEPARLCLRCHHRVMQQRKMLRAGLPPQQPSSDRLKTAVADTVRDPVRRHKVSGDAGLIVQREARSAGDGKYDLLAHRRRRAQVAARRALEFDPPAKTPHLLDRAS